MPFLDFYLLIDQVETLCTSDPPFKTRKCLNLNPACNTDYTQKLFLKIFVYIISVELFPNWK